MKKPEHLTPVTVTRETLYKQVWETPMSRLAEQYGLSGNGLAKICRRLNVPYPGRGYWARKAAGKHVIVYQLPKADADTPDDVVISPSIDAPKPEPAPAVKAAVEAAQTTARSIVVAERLTRPHPIIAEWIRDRAERRREARESRRRMGYGFDPGAFSDSDHRQHRILDALFKGLEKQGAKIKEGDRKQLVAEVQGERVEFGIREKQKQIRRPRSESKRRLSYRLEKAYVQELKPSGKLVFSIKTYLPDNLRREWLENDKHSMESLVPEIIATFIAAGPLLVAERLEREEAERLRRIEEMRRWEEERRRKREHNQWRRFLRYANQHKEAALAREFLAELKPRTADLNLQESDRSAADWIAWLEQRADQIDPLKGSLESIFYTLNRVTDWSKDD